jgi:hypothetical protein
MSPSLTAWESTAETTRFAWAIRDADKPSEAISATHVRRKSGEIRRNSTAPKMGRILESSNER